MKNNRRRYTVFFILILTIGFSMGVFCSPITINWIQMNNEDISLKSADSKPFFEDLYNLDINITWGGVNRDEGSKIKLHQSGIFISGRTNSIGAGDFDSVLIKMDESGNEQWNTTWGGTELDYSGYIDFDSSNNIFVGGNTDSFGPSAPNPNFLLIKYDNSGAQLWNRTWGTSEGEWGGRIVVDSQDNVYYAGNTWGHIASSGYAALVKHTNAGNEVWTEYWGSGTRNNPTGITIDSLDNIYITGYGGNTVDQDVCLLKYTSSGSLVMTRLWGGSGLDRGYGIQVDSLGNIYITGRTESFGVNTDAFLLKYNSFGDLQWSKIWGGSQWDAAYPIAIDSSNNIYIAGDTESFGDLNGDSFIVKYNSEGDEIWNYTWGGNNLNSIRGMIIDSSDNIYVTGLTENYGAGDADIFLLKFSPIDLEIPEITINSPTYSQIFGKNAPSYDLSITGLYEKIWYTLDDGITNITASGPTGIIDQTEWDKLTDGIVTITFYANNYVGYIGSAQVQIVKHVTEGNGRPEIPGYDLIVIVGVTCVIALLILKRRTN